MNAQVCSRGLFALMAALALWGWAPASASALSCDGRLVEIGDSEAYVRSICGDPTQFVSRMEQRGATIPYVVRTGGPYAYVYPYAQYVTVQVDVLVYDFGPTRFIDELTFENGVLRADRIAGYGTVRGGAARREARRAAREAARHRDDE
jgi:hypothetical protein